MKRKLYEIYDQLERYANNLDIPVLFTKEQESTYMLTTLGRQMIFIQDRMCITDTIIHLAHEIGHAVDYRTNCETPEDFMDMDDMEIAEREMVAWIYAFQTLSHFGFNKRKRFGDIVRSCLITYFDSFMSISDSDAKADEFAWQFIKGTKAEDFYLIDMDKDLESA